jgi:hypothetical protein
MAHATAAQPITVGVDTHLDLHVAHANDQLGRRVGTRSVPTTPAGYQALLTWAHRLGEPVAWGWKAPVPPAPPWPASWPPTARSWWRSTGATGLPAAAAASPTRPTPRRPPARSRPARPP